MRAVSGLDRPWIQWTFVTLGIVLVAVAAAEGIAIMRTRAALEAARSSESNARLERQQLAMELSRERATRGVLAGDVARLRQDEAKPPGAPPTLTLTPLARRAATPPAPVVEAPVPDQVIALRLVLPRSAAPGSRAFTVTIRKWNTGETVWLRGGLTAGVADNRPAVIAFVVGDALAAGSYEVLLKAVNAAGESLDVATYEVSIAPASR